MQNPGGYSRDEKRYGAKHASQPPEIHQKSSIFSDRDQEEEPSQLSNNPYQSINLNLHASFKSDLQNQLPSPKLRKLRQKTKKILPKLSQSLGSTLTTFGMQKIQAQENTKKLQLYFYKPNLHDDKQQLFNTGSTWIKSTIDEYKSSKRDKEIILSQNKQYIIKEKSR